MNLDIFMRWWWYAGSGSDLTIIKTQHTSDHQGGLRKWKEMFFNKLRFLGKFGSSMFLWRCKCYIWIKPIHYIYVHCTTCILEKVTFRPKEDKRNNRTYFTLLYNVTKVQSYTKLHFTLLDRQCRQPARPPTHQQSNQDTKFGFIS